MLPEISENALKDTALHITPLTKTERRMLRLHLEHRLKPKALGKVFGCHLLTAARILRRARLKFNTVCDGLRDWYNSDREDDDMTAHCAPMNECAVLSQR
jgi:hypothetical protein